MQRAYATAMQQAYPFTRIGARIRGGQRES
jgi:hypothetical protein